MLICGTRLFGRVDRVAGVGYIATKFFHLQQIPLIPLGSYAVYDGSERGSQFLGHPVGFRIKSILAAYLRAVGFVLALIGGLVGAFSAALVLVPAPNPQALPMVPVALAVGFVLPTFLLFACAPAPWWCLGWLAFAGASGGFVWSRGGIPMDLLHSPDRDAWLGLIAANAGFALDALLRPLLGPDLPAAHALGARLHVSEGLVSMALKGVEVHWREEHQFASPSDPTSRVVASEKPGRAIDPLDEAFEVLPQKSPAKPGLAPGKTPSAGPEDWPELLEHGPVETAKPAAGNRGDSLAELVRYGLIGLGLSVGVLVGALAVATDREIEAWELKAGREPSLKIILDLHRMGGRGMVFSTLVGVSALGFGSAAVCTFGLVMGRARLRAEQARRSILTPQGWSGNNDPGFVFAGVPPSPTDLAGVVGPDGPIGPWTSSATERPSSPVWSAANSRFAAPRIGSAASEIPGAWPQGIRPPASQSREIGQRQAPIELIGTSVALLGIAIFTFVQLTWLEIRGGEMKVWWGIALAYNTLGKEAAVAVCAVPGVCFLIKAMHRIATD